MAIVRVKREAFLNEHGRIIVGKKIVRSRDRQSEEMVDPEVVEQRFIRKLKVTLREILMRTQNSRCYRCNLHQYQYHRRFDIHRVEAGGVYHWSNCVLVCPKFHHIIEGLNWDQLKHYMENLTWDTDG
jgi:hypothetical protein